MNALYYNEEGSQIANDAAATLRVCLVAVYHNFVLSRPPMLGYARSRMEATIISPYTALLSARFFSTKDPRRII